MDTAVTGLKRKDKRNGFAIPPQLSARTLAGLARHPGWVANILTTEPLRFATFPEGSTYGRWGMSNQLREQAIRPEDVSWLKQQWEGPVVVKGCSRSRMRWLRWTPVRTRWCSPTTADASSTAPGPAGAAAGRGRRGRRPASRCTSTRASARAATSPRRSASAPAE